MNEQDLADLFEQAQMPDLSPANTPQPGVPVQDIQILGAGDMDVSTVTMDDMEIDNILQNHIRNSTTWVGSQIATQQAKAMQYYLGLAEGDLAAPGIQGRSTIVDTTVSDVIEWMMPSLMEIFFASGNVVKFTPNRPQDTAGAKMMTKLANHVINDQNPGFQIFLDWFKNALLNKVGVAKVWWENKTTVTRETYSGITDEQLSILSDDDEMVITSIVSYVDPHAEKAAMAQFKAQQQAVEQYQKALPQMQQAVMIARAKMAQQPAPMPAPGAPMPGGPQPQGAPMPGMPPGAPAPQPSQGQPMPGQPPQAGAQPPAMPQVPPPPPPPQPIDVSKLPQLHDVVMTRSKKAGYVAIEAMNSEDFLIDEVSRRVGDGFTAHRVCKTLSELRAEGYGNLDNIDLDSLSSDPEAETVQDSEVLLSRESLQQIYKPQELEEYGDESQRKIWLYECYLPIDCDGDGIAEWRKIVRAGNAILENVVVDGPPFATLCPVPIPGLFYGRSVAELAMPMQYAKTGVLRAMIDNMNVQVNGRSWAIESQVNMDDLLTNRPGGVVRVKSANAVGMLQQGMADAQGAYQLLQFLDQQSQERTGVTKYTQGTDADTLNHTATGIENITARADLRLKLIARMFAETGVKDLMRLVQKLLCKHQDKAMAIEIDGGWVDVDPRVWNNEYNMKVTVGLGTGDKTRRVQHLTALSQVQQAGMQLGICDPSHMYNTACELVDALDLGDSSQYFKPPPPPPQVPPPPPPNPEVMKVQGMLQIEKQKADDARNLANLTAQLDAQAEERRAQNQMQIEAQKQQAEAQRQQLADAQNQAWEREKFYAQIASNEAMAAMKAGVDSNTAASMNSVLVKSLDGQMVQQIPIDHIEAMQQLGLQQQGQAADIALRANDQAHQQRIDIHNAITGAHQADRAQSDNVAMQKEALKQKGKPEGTK